MASFFEDLFNSIFVPGPTPTIIVATNASFAALQLLLLLLLAGTQSIHFVILSVLCGGLWWAINWFVREVQTLKAQEQQTSTQESSSRAGPGASAEKELRTGQLSAQGGIDGHAADSEDTETEAEDTQLRRRAGRKPHGVESIESSTSSLRPQVDDTRKRTSTGDVSGTDSEWEKLSESDIKH